MHFRAGLDKVGVCAAGKVLDRPFVDIERKSGTRTQLRDYENMSVQYTGRIHKYAFGQQAMYWKRNQMLYCFVFCMCQPCPSLLPSSFYHINNAEYIIVGIQVQGFVTILCTFLIVPHLKLLNDLPQSRPPLLLLVPPQLLFLAVLHPLLVCLWDTVLHFDC